MTTEELKEIIVEYRKKSDKVMIINEESAFQLERFADYVENNIETFDDIDDEKELWDTFLHDHDEGDESGVDGVWDDYFPEGEEDDSITDYLTKE